MSLFKQLLLLISVLFLVVFSFNFLLSINKIKSYLESEAQVHAQDTATSLGLSISPYMVEETDPVIETMMNAIYDMGYYQEIKLVNLDNKPLVTLTHAREIEGVPAWFVENLAMKTARAKSEISSGWSQSGVIHVSINPSLAYLTLYEQAKSGFYYSLGAFIVSIVILLLVLHFTLMSLNRIGQLALSIAGGRFETIEPLPWTTEVRNVTKSMNIMSGKIAGTVRKLNAKLEIIGSQLNKDDLTGLFKKSGFEMDMKKLFVAESEAFILMIKIDGLSELVKSFGSDSIDQFLKEFAQILKDIASQNKQGDIIPYRFFGSEFLLLVRQLNVVQTEQIARQLSHDLVKLGKNYSKPDLAHIGVAHFNPFGTTEENLLAAHEAYEQAQLIGVNGYYIRAVKDKAKDISEWKSLVFDIVEHQGYEVSFVGLVEDFQSGQCLMEEALTQAYDKKGQLIAIGTFVSIAEKFAKIVDLDKGVITKVVDYIYSTGIQHAITINVSTRTIKDSAFRFWLVKLMQKNQTISAQLVFGFSAYAVAKDVSVYKEFIDFVHELNIRVMIKRFETQVIFLEDVKYLNPDFIRLARSIGNGIVIDDSKKAFVETLQEVCDLLEISVLAENIQSDEDYNCIKAMGVSGVSR